MLAGIHTFMGDYSGVYENENIVDEEATTDLMLLCKSYNIVYSILVAVITLNKPNQQIKECVYVHTFADLGDIWNFSLDD